jgi:hypothetical protein
VYNIRQVLLPDCCAEMEGPAGGRLDGWERAGKEAPCTHPPSPQPCGLLGHCALNVAVQHAP